MSTKQRPKKKICPYCSISLHLDEEICFSCKERVGKLSKYGMAKKPFNCWTYIACFLSWLGFYQYMRWAFF